MKHKQPKRRQRNKTLRNVCKYFVNSLHEKVKILSPFSNQNKYNVIGGLPWAVLSALNCNKNTKLKLPKDMLRKEIETK